MTTGDHPVTAQAIAREMGISEDGSRVMTGAQLDGLSDEELDDLIEVLLSLRAFPKHKHRIVHSLQKVATSLP